MSSGLNPNFWNCLKSRCEFPDRHITPRLLDAISRVWRGRSKRMYALLTIFRIPCSRLKYASDILQNATFFEMAYCISSLILGGCVMPLKTCRRSAYLSIRDLPVVIQSSSEMIVWLGNNLPLSAHPIALREALRLPVTTMHSESYVSQ